MRQFKFSLLMAVTCVMCAHTASATGTAEQLQKILNLTSDPTSVRLQIFKNSISKLEKINYAICQNNEQCLVSLKRWLNTPYGVDLSPNGVLITTLLCWTVGIRRHRKISSLS